MAVCGLPQPQTNHTTVLADMAIEMLARTREFNEGRPSPLQIRIGLNTGPVVAGVIGRSKFIYDLWGDTVNTASRMESCGLPDRIQVTDATQQALVSQFDFEERGDVEIRVKRPPAHLAPPRSQTSLNFLHSCPMASSGPRNVFPSSAVLES